MFYGFPMVFLWFSMTLGKPININQRPAHRWTAGFVAASASRLLLLNRGGGDHVLTDLGNSPGSYS